MCLGWRQHSIKPDSILCTSNPQATYLRPVSFARSFTILPSSFRSSLNSRSNAAPQVRGRLVFYERRVGSGAGSRDPADPGEIVQG